MNEDKEFYTVNEVAEILGVTRNTLSNWRNKGLLKVVKVDKKVLVSKEELQNLIKRNEQ